MRADDLSVSDRDAMVRSCASSGAEREESEEGWVAVVCV